MSWGPKALGQAQVLLGVLAGLWEVLVVVEEVGVAQGRLLTDRLMLQQRKMWRWLLRQQHLQRRRLYSPASCQLVPHSFERCWQPPEQQMSGLSKHTLQPGQCFPPPS